MNQFLHFRTLALNLIFQVIFKDYKLKANLSKCSLFEVLINSTLSLKSFTKNKRRKLKGVLIPSYSLNKI